jgi:hypothetical protein
MMSLFLACTGGQDWGVYYTTVLSTGWANGLVFIWFIAFFFFAVFNVVTSIFVERVMQLAQPDIEDRLLEMQAANSKFAEDFYILCRCIVHEDVDGRIDYKQFRALLKNSHVRDMLAVRGVDIHETKHFFDMISMSEDSEETTSGIRTISLEMLAAVCMRSKGMATSVDLLTLRYDNKRSLVKIMQGQKSLKTEIALVRAQAANPELMPQFSIQSSPTSASRTVQPSPTSRTAGGGKRTQLPLQSLRMAGGPTTMNGNDPAAKANGRPQTSVLSTGAESKQSKPFPLVLENRSDESSSKASRSPVMCIVEPSKGSASLKL